MHARLRAWLPAAQALDPAKYPLPEPYPYKEAAKFFVEPEVTPADQLPPLKWTAPDEEALVAYLVGEDCAQGARMQDNKASCAGRASSNDIINSVHS